MRADSMGDGNASRFDVSVTLRRDYDTCRWSDGESRRYGAAAPPHLGLFCAEHSIKFAYCLDLLLHCNLHNCEFFFFFLFIFLHDLAGGNVESDCNIVVFCGDAIMMSHLNYMELNNNWV